MALRSRFSITQSNKGVFKSTRSGRFDGWIPEAEGGGVPEQRARGRGRKRRRAVVAATEPQKSVVPASGLSVPGATSAERRAADFVVVANQID